MRNVAFVSIAIAGLTIAGSALAAPRTVTELRSLFGQVVPVQSCPADHRYCAPGTLGPGGCYTPGNTRCVEGFTCPSHMRICIRDRRGYDVPYCYEPGLPNTCAE